MRISVVGKVRRSGVSKSGRAYDFVELHFTAPARGIEGEAAQTVTFAPDVFPYEAIGRGVYDADFDRHGNLLALTTVQAATSKQ